MTDASETKTDLTRCRLDTAEAHKKGRLDHLPSYIHIRI